MEKNGSHQRARGPRHNLTLTLNETTNASGIFRNSVAVSVVQTATVNATNNILETDNGNTLTASYTDTARPANTSNDTAPAQVASSNSVTAESCCKVSTNCSATSTPPA